MAYSDLNGLFLKDFFQTQNKPIENLLNLVGLGLILSLNKDLRRKIKLIK